LQKVQWLLLLLLELMLLQRLLLLLMGRGVCPQLGKSLVSFLAL